MSVSGDIAAYNSAQSTASRAICDALCAEIDNELTEAESKVWHGGPVWFIDGNPIVGYWVRKNGVQLLFWSGQSFGEPGLQPEGKFMAAEAHFTDSSQINKDELKKWLIKSREIQWDYKNLVKKKGKLERIK